VAPCDPPLGDGDPAVQAQVLLVEQRSSATVLV
jgi:hypothetical protein